MGSGAACRPHPLSTPSTPGPKGRSTVSSRAAVWLQVSFGLWHYLQRYMPGAAAAASLRDSRGTQRAPSPLPRRQHRRHPGSYEAARSRAASWPGPASSCGPCCPRGSTGPTRWPRTGLLLRSGWPRSSRSAADGCSQAGRARPRHARSGKNTGIASGLRRIRSSCRCTWEGGETPPRGDWKARGGSRV